MGNVTDLSDLLNRSSGGASGAPENIFFFKIARVGGAAAAATVTGRLNSFWRYEGSPGAGEIPTTAENPSKSTSGAIVFTNASAGFEKWITHIAAGSLNAGTLILYDRLAQVGGFDSTLTTEQTVNTPSLTRNTNAIGNIMFAEIHSQLGATNRNLTVEYVSDGDVTASSTVQMGATSFREVNRVLMLPVAGGHRGVKTVNKLVLNGSTGTAGNFSIVIGRPLAWVPIGVAGGTGWRDFTTGLPGLPKIDDNACLSFLWLASTTVAPEIFGALSTIQA